MKKTCAILIAITLLGCRKDPISVEQTNNGAIRVDLLFEHDGCKVYRFIDDGRPVYFTSCQGTTEYTYQTGPAKARTTHRMQSLNEAQP